MKSAIRSIHNSGLLVSEIVDVTLLPHNGCRPPNKKKSLINKIIWQDIQEQIWNFQKMGSLSLRIATFKKSYPPGQHGNFKKEQSNPMEFSFKKSKS